MELISALLIVNFLVMTSKTKSKYKKTKGEKYRRNTANKIKYTQRGLSQGLSLVVFTAADWSLSDHIFLLSCAIYDINYYDHYHWL